MPAAGRGAQQLQQQRQRPKRWRFVMLGLGRGSVGWQGTPWIRPWRLGSRIHAADTPASPHYPGLDRFMR